MKQYVELYLVVVLVALLYFKPSSLNFLTSSILGKISLLVGVIYLAHNHGISSGMIGAIIVILMIHNVIEGVDETLEESPKENDDESVSSDEDEEDEENEMKGDDEHQKADLLENEAQLKSDLVSSPEKQDEEPEGVAMDAKTIEGFSLYN